MAEAMREEQDRDVMPPLSLEAYRSLLPSIAGLGLSSTTVSAIVQGARHSTGVSADGGTAVLVSCAIAALLFVSTLFVKRYTKRFVFLGTFFAIHLSGLSALALAMLGFAHADPSPLLSLALSVGVTCGSTWLQFYWLRKLRGASAQAAVIVVFSALGISEFLGYVLSFVSQPVVCLLGVGLTFAQFGAVRISRVLDVPSDAFPAISQSYLGTDPEHFSNTGFLVAAAVGIWFLSVPLGMGRGFPAGEAIAMSLVPRFLSLVFTLVVCVFWVRHGLRSRMRAITTSIWVVMEAFLGLAAVFFAIWPNTVSVGASFVMGASSVLTAFVWYLSIAFVSFGWRDPFYYTSGAWITVNLLTVAGMRLDALATQVFPSNTPVIIAFMCLFTLVSTQVVFTRLLASPSQEREEREVLTQAEASAPAGASRGQTAGEQGAPHPEPQQQPTLDAIRRVPLMGVLAIAQPQQVPMVSQSPDARIASSVIALGQRFGLTGREIEVLTLYALGHTQARVSEELQLSQNTVHTHIKRIYEKTDLHSRQEILDYINEYGAAGV